MAYEIGSYQFDLNQFFPKQVFDRITDIRVRTPQVVLEAAQLRKKRSSLTGENGKLMVLAADHPARRVTSAAGSSHIMGNRHSYLGRILRVLADPRCEGILGTPDIIEDLLIVHHMVKEAGGPGFLDSRILAGTMNRGGLSGVAFEMADTFTSYTVESVVRYQLDAAKIMFRLDIDSPSSGRTITQCACAITDCVRAGLPIFVEPLPVQKSDGGYQVIKTPESLIEIIGIASALGESSLGTWIKIPFCEDYPRVVQSTSCPVLMLGGESKGDPSPILYQFAEGMLTGGNVRGTLVGRNVHHPGQDDPLAVSVAIHGIVHEGLSGDDAVSRLHGSRDLALDSITKYL